MSDKFNGFTQDEIEKITSGKINSVGSATGTSMKQAFRGHNGIRRMPAKAVVNSSRKPPMTKSTSIAKKPDGKEVIKASPDDSLEGINLDRSMSKSIEEALFYIPSTKTTETTKKNEAKAVLVNSPTSSLNDSSILKMPSDQATAESMTPTTADSSVSNNHKMNIGQPFRGISLKDFESHRKFIEDQNKQKKQLLYKAIEHHSQKTAAETRKIEEIKNELAKLDNDLATDVAILRKQIDNACIHFANIEKQYIRIESQFLKSKMELHNAAEKKELLTEHLCTVIAHNEDRKAQKLSELMLKVGLTPEVDFDSLPQDADK